MSIRPSTWTADNGNGTFTNPIFFDEFSDPDIVRVGDIFYLTGTTMHTMPGLPVLQSLDLVNWSFVGYACERLDLGPEYRLENDGTIYGQGIWAPCFRYHNGNFHIFTNVNGRTTQHFTATDPAGPWRQESMKCTLHDLTVLFDDDGKVYVLWGYEGIHLAQLNDNLDDIVPGTERMIIPEGAGMGEGCHFYKIDGTYFIFSAWFLGHMRMPCARASRPEGPYEVIEAVSIDEEFGILEGNRLAVEDPGCFRIIPPNLKSYGRLAMHQGGIVSTPKGEWWGFSMMDCNSIGRLTCLSPVTWHNGWPYFGLPGNLTRTPRTWVKPYVDRVSTPCTPFRRSDDFDNSVLNPIWQWNHVPSDHKWSLNERPGCLRLHSLPAGDFWHARNSLTQRAIGPVSTPTVCLELGGLQIGDVAGLALLNYPYAWIGVRRTEVGLEVCQYNQLTGRLASEPFEGVKIWLRAECDFMEELGSLSYGEDGVSYRPLGDNLSLVFQLTTFQGVRYALFNYNTEGVEGGWADFSQFQVDEPRPLGFTRSIPYGRIISLSEMTEGLQLANIDGILGTSAVAGVGESLFRIIDRGLGRVSLQSVLDDRRIAVVDEGVTLAQPSSSDGQTFQWIEMPRGELMLMSLKTHRYLRIDAEGISADAVGAMPDRSNGASFDWVEHN